MPIVPAIFALIWIVRLIARSSSGQPSSVASGHSHVQWGAAAVGRVIIGCIWFGFASWALVAGLTMEPSVVGVLELTTATIALVCFGTIVFVPWHVLRMLSRRASPKVVYYASLFSLVHSATRETKAAAILLSALAAAHRGPVSKEERKWLWKLLREETSSRGDFGTAFGVLETIEARAAQERGRHQKALDHRMRARWILGTVTYLPLNGVSESVRTLAHELIDLECVSLGIWGSMESTPEKNLTRLTRAMRDWARVQFHHPHVDERRAAKSRARAQSSLVEELYARSATEPVTTADDARSRACHDYLTLVSGHPLAPSAAIQMLHTFDVLLHPEAPDTIFSEETRGDDALVRSVHDEVAKAITDAFYQSPGVPIHVMPQLGPISARVYQQLEALILADLEREFVQMIESNQSLERHDNEDEWLFASRIRGRYRRVQFTLGDAAAAQVWPRLMFAYCNFGVKLSEEWPRRRALAHAVFRCLYDEAVRFQDHSRIGLLEKNCRVTASG